VSSAIIAPCCDDEDRTTAARARLDDRLHRLRSSAAMRLYVIRHAHARGRSSWDGSDAERPLSKKGRRQAARIAEQLADAGITRLVSSPAARCVQTLEPLGARLGLAVTADGRLHEGSSGAAARGLADEVCALCAGSGGGDGNHIAAAVCSHGDVIPELLRELRHHGGTRIDDPFQWPKASTWIVTWDGQRWVSARYSPPPTS
jgi:broad specificity phosphatase PhoE